MIAAKHMVYQGVKLTMFVITMITSLLYNYVYNSQSKIANRHTANNNYNTYNMYKYELTREIKFMAFLHLKI